jgi:hypothetical protein
MENEKGNPGDIGMQGDSFEDAAKNTSGSNSFFSALEDQVNGSIQDQRNTEATHQAQSGSEQATHNQPQDGSNNVAPPPEQTAGWEKRYKDSSREAVKLKEELNKLKPFVPVLDAMREDSGLVEHVKDYLMNGGKPAKSVQEQLDLPEDFIFDQQEAMTNPDSDSAKVMNAHVDQMVNNRVNHLLEGEKKKSQQVQMQIERKKQLEEFRQRNNMDEDQFKDFVTRAKSHKLSLDDINYLLNRDKVAQNTANSTRQDMLNQMKNVQNMPATASGANSQGDARNVDSELFDGLLDLDDGLDNLFG